MKKRQDLCPVSFPFLFNIPYTAETDKIRLERDFKAIQSITQKKKRKKSDAIFLLLQEKDDGRMYVFPHMRNRVPRFTPFYPSHHVFLHTRSRKYRKKQVGIVSRTGDDGTRAQAQSGEHSLEAGCFPMKVAKRKGMKYNRGKGKNRAV